MGSAMEALTGAFGSRRGRGGFGARSAWRSRGGARLRRMRGPHAAAGRLRLGVERHLRHRIRHPDDARGQGLRVERRMGCTDQVQRGSPGRERGHGNQSGEVTCAPGFDDAHDTDPSASPCSIKVAGPERPCAPAHPAQRGIARKVTRVLHEGCMPDGCRRGQRLCSSPGGSGLSGGPRPASTGRPETSGVIPAPTPGRQCRIRVPPASTPRPAWTWGRSSGRAPISPGLSRDTRKNRN